MAYTAIPASSGGGTCPLTLVERKVFSAEASTYTFSGLSGDTDERYEYQIDGIGGSDSVVGAGLVWTLNGGLGTMTSLGSITQGYTAHAIAGTGSAALAVVATGAAPGKAWVAWGSIFIKTGKQRMLLGQYSVFDATDASNSAGYVTGRCSDTATAVTSMTFASTGVKIFGANSVMTLWKRSP